MATCSNGESERRGIRNDEPEAATTANRQGRCPAGQCRRRGQPPAGRALQPRTGDAEAEQPDRRDQSDENGVDLAEKHETDCITAKMTP
jgi:hypothetical protein